jgi:hypothetical protein
MVNNLLLFFAAIGNIGVAYVARTPMANPSVLGQVGRGSQGRFGMGFGQYAQEVIQTACNMCWLWVTTLCKSIVDTSITSKLS